MGHRRPACAVERMPTNLNADAVNEQPMQVAEALQGFEEAFQKAGCKPKCPSWRAFVLPAACSK
jgi:hypothetical protein